MIPARFIWMCLLLACWTTGAFCAEEKWPGIDETVVNRIAREQGHPARESLINTGEGDLQLFVFLAAGVVGGFVAGYCWRMLVEGSGRKNLQNREKS